MTATATIQQVHESAKMNNSSRIRHLTAETIPVGKWGRQGDIYFHRVDDKHPRGPRTENYQLAEGTSRGARHVAMSLNEGDDSVKVYQGTALPAYAEAGTFLGPLVVSEKEFKIFHPEHPHVILPPGCYQITHQRNMHLGTRQKD